MSVHRLETSVADPANHPVALASVIATAGCLTGLRRAASATVDLQPRSAQAAKPMTAVDEWEAQFEHYRSAWIDATRIRVPPQWLDAYAEAAARHKELTDAGRW